MSDGDQALIPEDPSNPYPLGRHLHHDPRNRDYPIRALLEASEPRQRPWWRRGIYNQGTESSCTAQAAAGVLETSPNRQAHRPSLPHYDETAERFDLYSEARRHDPWPGEDYAGASTDAPFKVLRARSHITEWRWCFGLADVLDTLNGRGPVAVGTLWYTRMFYPDADGHIEISGDVAGGHAYELLWNDAADRQVRAINSWGDWGQNGRFWLTHDQLDRLLGENGEAVAL